MHFKSGGIEMHNLIKQIKQLNFWRVLSLCIVSFAASAELTSLSDNDLSEVDGAGIGLVMDDFAFSHGHSPSEGKVFRITGIKDTSGEDVVINVNQLYIARSGSPFAGAVRSA